MRLPIVKLLTRPGCSLCDQARFVLRKVKQVAPFEGKVVNILNEPAYLVHNDFLPVILVEEEPVCKTRVEEAIVRDAVIAATKRLN